MFLQNIYCPSFTIFTLAFDDDELEDDSSAPILLIEKDVFINERVVFGFFKIDFGVVISFENPSASIASGDVSITNVAGAFGITV